MRQIKFRGRTFNGYLLYGDLIQHNGKCYIGEWAPELEVEKESVAQFVGYDANGKEVYEGDKLINDRDNTTFKAAMNHIYTVKKYRLLED